jgi:tRNA-dihydrouridine synthase
MNIWQQLKLNGPIFVLAPMEDVTDSVFRQVVAKSAAPDLFFTEFTNVEGLCSAGRSRIDHRLQFTSAETPLIAQIWGRTPEKFYQIAQELSTAGFAGIDLNMGCPDRSVVKRGECSGLISNPSLAAEMIAATKQGAGQLPVSVKTRCGLSSWVTEEWVSFLLSQNIVTLTLHGRIAKDMSKLPARWEEIAKAVALRDQLAPQTIIIGNGDVTSYQDGLAKIAQTGVDGVMVGRGIFSNPWLFNSHINPLDIPLVTRLELLQFHLQLFNHTWGHTKNYNLLKKFFKIYLQNEPDLKKRLMETKSIQQALDIFNEDNLRANNHLDIL